jgi:hypothetical protein
MTSMETRARQWTAANLSRGTGTVPPELLGSVPREVRLTASGIAAAGVAVGLFVFAVIAALVMIVANARGEDERALRARDAVAANAEVVQVSVRRGEHPRRSVTYSYEAGGRSYSGRSELGERERPIEKGAHIRIAFLSSRPDTSWRIGHEPGGFPLWPIPLIAMVPIGAALGVAWGLRRQWVLLSEGRVAQALVTGQKKVGGHKHTAYRITYEFESLSGARHTGRHDAGKSPASVGASVPLIYHRDNPRWNAPYPLSLVRPARIPYVARQRALGSRQWAGGSRQ